VQLGAVARRVAGGGSGDEAAPRREDGVGFVGQRFDDDVTADAVRLANPADDDRTGGRAA
jgi:hypothetical protein